MKTKFGLLLIALAVVLAMPSWGQESQRKGIAVLPTVDLDKSFETGEVRLVYNRIGTVLKEFAGYRVFERVDISSIMDEQKFQNSGMVSDAEIRKIGEMKGADFVLLTFVSKMSGNRAYIEGRLVDVETGEWEKSGDGIAADITKIDEAVREMARKMLGVRNQTSGGQSNSNYDRQMIGGQDFVETTFGINMKMVYVEGGSFVMGCTGEQGSDCDADEKNTRRVTLDGYYIGMTEITQGQWQKVMGTSVEQQRNKADANWPLRGGTDYPMYYVSWEEAMAFCQELSRQTGKKYTLPTEAQWEYAARGGNRNDGTKYSGSYSVDAVAWYGENSGDVTHIVGSKRPNGLGLYDMSGNVYEWCRDWYADSYIGYQTDNPTGPSSGSSRVFRGGSWCGGSLCCRVSDRDWGSTDRRNPCRGFRVGCLP